MAQQKSGGQKKTSLIDPIYQKFTKSVIRALGSTEFYEFFMDAIAGADNQFQFSNRKAIKTVDLEWVDAVEESLNAFQTIISNPRNVIHEEELIVNVANAKKAGSDVVRHLAQHASLVEDFDEGRGNVRPSRLMQKFREDSTSLYENRLVFTTMEMAFQFVKIRHDALFAAMSDEFGAKLRLDSTMESATEQVHMEMFLHIKEIEGALETDEKNRDIFDRISRMYRVLSVYMTSQFAQSMNKLNRVKGSITKTNVLKKNPNYHKILQLYEFLRGYEDIGYTIRIVEQNPQIDETFQRDIYHNVLFNYLILKGYLEDEEDRQVPAPSKSKKRSLKPKFIKEIIEELTEDYDLPDVEIRKVLIEELTKEQLMHEEAEERRRLVEEQARRKKEEQERIRQEEAAEKERIRKEKEAEKERLRLEKEAEEARQRQMRMEQAAEDRRRCKLFKAELERFQNSLLDQLEAREKAAAKKAAELAAFEAELKRQEEEERRRLEEAELAKQREAEEQERLKREAQERAEQEKLAERERLERLAAELRLKKEEEARLAQLRAEEELRLAQQREAEEKLRQQQLEEQRAREEEERRKQDLIDTAATQVYLDEVTVFFAALPQRMQLRQAEIDRANEERRLWEEERRRRRAERIPLFQKRNK